jgi:hypothetical protein
MEPTMVFRTRVLVLLMFIAVVFMSIGYTYGQAPAKAPRLTAKVSMRLRAVRVQEALDSISRATGVPLRSSPDVAELHVSIFTHDLELSVLQAMLAEVMHLSWRTESLSDSGKSIGYVLYRSARNKAEEESLLAAGDQAFRRGVEAAIRALSASPEELERIKAENPVITRMLVSPTGRAALTLLGDLPPSQRQAVYDGDVLRLTKDQLGDAAQQGLAMLGKTMDESRLASPDAQPLANGFEPQSLELRRTGEGADSYVSLSAKGPGTAISRAVYGSSTHLAYPDSLTPKTAKADLADADRPVDVNQAITAKTFDELLEQVAGMFHANCIAEAYTDYNLGRGRYTLAPGATSLARVFDTIAPPVWWKRGDVYLFQRKMWFIDRLAEVPDSLVQSVKELRKKGARLTLEEWGDLGRLRPQQWMALQTLGLGEFDMLLEKHLIAALYGNLNLLQRTSLFTPAGLDAVRLPASERERLFRWALASDNTSAPRFGPEDVRSLRVTAVAESNKTTFRAVALRNNGEEVTLREQTLPGVPGSRNGKKADKH